ncbi:hypothetical protein ACSBR1_039866 [Camellia fascicularis]
MICSISAGFLYASASFYNEVKRQERRHLIAFWLILVAMGAMVVAFITGTFTMLSHSLGIATTVCIVGSFSFFIFIPEVFKLYDYEYITDPDSAIISEEIRIMFQVFRPIRRKKMYLLMFSVVVEMPFLYFIQPYVYMKYNLLVV